MGIPKTTRSHTLPSSPTHSFSSSSSSDFEFTISLSPHKSSAPADELFYKGQLLPLHLSPRISMVRTLLASSSTSSSSDATTSASRDSTASSNDSRSSFSTDLLLPRDSSSSRPSSVTDQDDEYKRLTSTTYIHPTHTSTAKKSKYFSFSRFSSVFQRKESKIGTNLDSEPESGSTGTHSSSVKRMSTTAKEVIRKYFNKVRPLYEKLSHNQSQISTHKKVTVTAGLCMKAEGSVKDDDDSSMIGRKENESDTILHSFSGNLRYPRRRSIVSSCPSSMRSSPSHSGILSRNKNVGLNSFQDSSSMEELQSAIQGAIAHCKNSMMGDNKSTMVSKEV